MPESSLDHRGRKRQLGAAGTVTLGHSATTNDLHHPSDSRCRHEVEAVLSCSPCRSRTTCHLWQFILRLLDTPEHNPSIIRWLDENKTTFKLVNSAAVARLWGSHKQKPNMNYETMGRALRQELPVVCLLVFSHVAATSFPLHRIAKQILMLLYRELFTTSRELA
ncbi:unnamed protein product [Protopolystoma xenopodis]|uniref:ETS domain-containing protein n=1 Tax=Protopolystoma xenopodis TaxID=117903 RepID=A0A3S5FCR2_9PLAT|nr:unnamed protein product [Protopolystoma xenopodis]